MSNLRDDIRELLQVSGWPASRLAKEAGIPAVCITRLLKGTRKGLHSDNVQKLLPFLYGDRRPTGATWDIPSETVPDVAAG